MKVSVIVPVYNMEKCLNDCIGSIVGQTYKELDIVLVNDGSTDHSMQLCCEWEKRDKRIRAFCQENGGVSAARNRGLEEARGEWVMFVDPDDSLLPEAVATLRQWTAAGIDIVAACCKVRGKLREETNFFFERDLEMRTVEEKMPLFRQLMDITYGQPEREFYTGIGVPWAKLYRRAFLEKRRLRFDTRLRRMQDNLFNMYAFFYAEGVVYKNIPVYLYDCSHINRYADGYNPKYKDIFPKVSQARMEAMERLELHGYDCLHTAYLNEQLQLLRDSLKLSVLNWKNPQCWREKKEAFKKLCSIYDTAYLKGLFHDKISRHIYRQFYLLEKRRNALLLYVVWNVVYPPVKRLRAIKIRLWNGAKL